MRTTIVCMVVMAAGCGQPDAGSPMKPPTAGPVQLLSLEVQPANATIAVEDGSAAPVAYSVVGHFSDGHDEAISDASFALDAAAQVLGAFAGAQFQASGGAAGSGQVQASARGLDASATLTVNVHTVHLGAGVPAGASEILGTNPATGTQSPAIAYPLDGALLPTSAKAPSVQWEGASAVGDLFACGCRRAGRASSRSSSWTRRSMVTGSRQMRTGRS